LKFLFVVFLPLLFFCVVFKLSKLGPVWTVGEVTRFLELYQQHGQKWNRIASSLSPRTPLQCEALFLCNRSLIMSDCLPNVLHLALMDRYNSSPALSRGNAVQSSSTRRRIAPTSAPAPNASSVNRPKRKLEFDGSSSAAGADDDTDRRDGMETLPFKKRMGGDGSSNASSPIPTPRAVSRIKAHEGNLYQPQINKLLTAAAATAESQQLGRFLKGNGHMYCMYEWFYSHLDRDYFALNEFSSMLNVKANFPLGNVPLLTRSEWAVVRRKLGRPRRLSPAFFASERAKLHAYREDVRSVRDGNPVVHPEAHGLDFFSVKDRLPVNCRVVVWRWSTRSPVGGCVIRAASNRYEVQCDDSEEHEWVSDLDVAAHCSEEGQLRVVSDHQDVCQGLSPLHPNMMGSASPLLASTAKAPRHYSAGELSQVALLARVNRMKSLILQAISAFHDHAERACVDKTPLCASFKRAYANLVVQLQYCNRLAAPVLRDMPTWPLGGVSAPRSEAHSLRDLPTAWLRKLSARCEQDATNTLEIATKAVLQKKTSFVFQPESKRLVSNAVTLAHYVQHVASLHELYLQSEINVALDMALTRIRPVYPENNDVFQQVAGLVSQIVGFLSDPEEKAPSH
jgi:hypothetical protein